MTANYTKARGWTRKTVGTREKILNEREMKMNPNHPRPCPQHNATQQPTTPVNTTNPTNKMLKQRTTSPETKSRMTSHRYGWNRSTFIPMRWNIRWWRHHHRIGVLNCRYREHFSTVLIKLYHTLRALMVVWVSIGLDRSGRHRGPRSCTIW